MATAHFGLTDPSPDPGKHRARENLVGQLFKADPFVLQGRIPLTRGNVILCPGNFQFTTTLQVLGLSKRVFIPSRFASQNELALARDDDHRSDLR
jgi:hypothetical protein